MPLDLAALQPLGWKPFFQQQLTPEEAADAVPLRVCQVQRTDLRALGSEGQVAVQFPRACRWSELLTVGDWILATPQGDQFYLQRVLERSNGFVRKAAGAHIGEQWVSANLEHVFVVMPCTDGFNISRLERYLALAAEGGVDPVIILTRADQCEDVDQRRAALPDQYPHHAVDARSAAAATVLRPYLGTGRTVAVVGSSGVGKSTLINTLAGAQIMLTGAVRAADGKGRHTTSWRELVQLPAGGPAGGTLLIDTPGMRELQLTSLDTGMDVLFGDIEDLATTCKFRNCAHAQEPGCAIQAAISAGQLEPRRLQNYLKMRQEQATHDQQLRAHHQATSAHHQAPKTKNPKRPRPNPRRRLSKPPSGE